MADGESVPPSREVRARTYMGGSVHGTSRATTHPHTYTTHMAMLNQPTPTTVVVELSTCTPIHARGIRPEAGTLPMRCKMLPTD